ncbi:MAG: redox-sensing transcriptional repressor Rex [Clostridia bacterium]
MATRSISKSTLQRLPIYLMHLKSLLPGGQSHISATTLALALGMGEVQVRKDLASVSEAGKPKVGYVITDLIEELENFLGYNDVDDAVVVGAGKLGRALLDYNGFANYGLNIVAAFDIDAGKSGVTDTGKSIFDMQKLEELCARLCIRIGILTVPADCAQAVCDRMVKSGILAILNFAPAHLIVPENVLVQNENIATSLAILSNRLKETIIKSSI